MIPADDAMIDEIKTGFHNIDSVRFCFLHSDKEPFWSFSVLCVLVSINVVSYLNIITILQSFPD